MPWSGMAWHIWGKTESKSLELGHGGGNQSTPYPTAVRGYLVALWLHASIHEVKFMQWILFAPG